MVNRIFWQEVNGGKGGVLSQKMKDCAPEIEPAGYFACPIGFMDNGVFPV
jgi:hypothetical protein